MGLWAITDLGNGYKIFNDHRYNSESSNKKLNVGQIFLGPPVPPRNLHLYGLGGPVPPASPAMDMACRARQSKKRHEHSMIRDRAYQGRLKNRATKYRCRTEQTNYRQCRIGSSGKVKTMTIIRAGQCKDTALRWGQSAMIDTITSH